MAPKSRCVVTGGLGFLGRDLAQQLLVDPEVGSVLIVDIATPSTSGPFCLLDGVEFAQGSVTDTDFLTRSFAGADAVFHCASIVDVSPVPSPALERVNVGGAEAVVAACRTAKVPLLIYTSSIDVTFTGEPVLNGNEDQPYATAPFFNEYTRTKMLAERAVLGASDGTLRTCALRPAHIYGPGDLMVKSVLDLVRRGAVPFRFGSGTCAYIYVTNCAFAHVLAWRALRDPARRDDVAGTAFFIDDTQLPMWEHVRPFLEHCGSAVPSVAIPVPVAYGAAVALASTLKFIHRLTGWSTPVDFTPYAVRAVSQDYFFDNVRAKKLLGYQPIVSRQTAVDLTTMWLRTLPGCPTTLHHIHMVFGRVMLILGILLFFFPALLGQVTGSAFGPTEFADAASGLLLTQTSGLIIGVLGVYSLAAALQVWSAPVLYCYAVAHAATAGALLLVYWTAHTTLAFLGLGLLQLAMAVVSFVLLGGLKPPSELRASLHMFSAPQLIHALLNGGFAMCMLIIPAQTLRMALLPNAGTEVSSDLVHWARMMGALETYMTFIYSASGLFPALEGFVNLSIGTRLGAWLLLFCGWMGGICIASQFLGCAGDGALAIAALLLHPSARRGA
eukprot:m.33176 g.33176  ORF g.33176 m.33176 type:complete len:614 (+) comp5597_c0_seq1:1963-3804(+)